MMVQHAFVDNVTIIIIIIIDVVAAAAASAAAATVLQLLFVETLERARPRARSLYEWIR